MSAGGGERPDRVARRAVVHGRVQGVFFRQSTTDRARELGIDGWVRNRPDGKVELHAEGPPDAVDVLIDWAHHGPAGADVTSVDVRDAENEGHSGFRAR